MNKVHIDLMKYLEATFDCSGLCQKPLFYLTRPLSDRRPKEACLVKAMSKFTSRLMYIGIGMLLSAAILIMMLSCQFPLWCYSYEKDSEEKEKTQEHEIEFSNI